MPETERLYSGMPINGSPDRRIIQAKLQRAHLFLDERLYDAPSRSAANASLDQIANVPGIEVIERRDCTADHYYRCAQYVFSHIKHEDWLPTERSIEPRDIWDNPLPFLSDHGYAETNDPTPGDVVAYGLVIDRDDGKRVAVFEHYGVYAGEGRVISKFDMGHVFRHGLHQVPTGYGSQIAFFTPHAGINHSDIKSDTDI